MQEMHESQLQERHRRGAWKLHTLRTCPECAFASTSHVAKEEEYHNRALFYERKRIEKFCEEEVRDTICHITNKQEGVKKNCFFKLKKSMKNNDDNQEEGGLEWGVVIRKRRGANRLFCFVLVSFLCL
jgi:hypothetical protein